MLDGPRLLAVRGPARGLVVLLHGYGADGHDLIDLAHSWRSLLPDVDFISPHAPDPCGMSPMGRQWFDLTFRDPHERWRGVQAAAPGLKRFLDTELQARSLGFDRLALVGFSQGAMMALHMGLRLQPAPVAVVGFSGLLVVPSDGDMSVLEREVVSRPPVFLAHGSEDEVIPAGALMFSAQTLSALGCPCEWHMSPGVGHGIDGEGLRQAGAFLQKNFC